MKLSGPVTIESERNSALRSHEYYVVSYDQDGNEVMGFKFVVDDKGEMWRTEEPFRLVEHVLIT